MLGGALGGLLTGASEGAQRYSPLVTVMMAVFPAIMVTKMAAIRGHSRMINAKSMLNPTVMKKKPTARRQERTIVSANILSNS